MAQKTSVPEEVAPEEVAERLHELAEEFEAGDEVVARTGNKTVELSPSDPLAYELTVRERGSVLRGNRESVTIRMDWSPPEASE